MSLLRVAGLVLLNATLTVAFTAAKAAQPPSQKGAYGNFAARFASPPAAGRILKIIHGWPDQPEAQDDLIRRLTAQGF
ncbi:MAG TPA: hypothetical protein VI136_11245, partial [Verrucomicrobiae bacterium]